MSEGWIVVTGASRGIGAAIAAELTRRGARVASLSRSGDAVAGKGFKCDVSDDDAIAKAFAAIAAEGPIIGLVNNAGQHSHTHSAELSTASFEETLRLNTTSVFVASRTAYPHLTAAGGGLIVNIGSLFDKLGVIDNVAYCASKAAVGAITRCLAVEWAKDKIGVVNVAPGYVETDLNRDFLNHEKTRSWLARRIPMARPGSVEEISRFVALLFVERIAFLTGETIYLDGGQGVNH
jgi:NAD(P)-dependent dehydrogenase (short-subunit alcohol dehydrogenase family)